VLYLETRQIQGRGSVGTLVTLRVVRGCVYQSLIKNSTSGLRVENDPDDIRTRHLPKIRRQRYHDRSLLDYQCFVLFWSQKFLRFVVL